MILKFKRIVNVRNDGYKLYRTAVGKELTIKFKYWEKESINLLGSFDASIIIKGEFKLNNRVIKTIEVFHTNIGDSIQKHTNPLGVEYTTEITCDIYLTSNKNNVGVEYY